MVFRVLEYKGHPITLKFKGDVFARLDKGDPVGVESDRNDPSLVHFMHKGGGVVKEFTLRKPAADRILKNLGALTRRQDSSVNVLNNLRLSFQSFFRDEARRFLPRWGIPANDVKTVTKRTNAFWWELPLELDSTDKVTCRIAFLRDTFYFILLFPKNLPNIRYRLTSPQIDAARQLFDKLLDHVNKNNGESFTLSASNYTMRPDQAILREMPDSQHAFAFMKTNSMENQ